MSFVYINYGGRPDVKIGSHTGENPDQRRQSYFSERGVDHEHQFAVPVPSGTERDVERRVHAILAPKRVSNNTELFYASLEEAKLAIVDALHQTAHSFPVQPSDEPASQALNNARRNTPEPGHQTAALPFDFTHGKTQAQRRDPSLFFRIVHEAETRPSKGGRKLEAIFEARNPNGLLARYKERFGSLESASLEVANALQFIQNYGGPNCTSAWPKRPELDRAFGIIEAVLSQ